MCNFNIHKPHIPKRFELAATSLRGRKRYCLDGCHREPTNVTSPTLYVRTKTKTEFGDKSWHILNHYRQLIRQNKKCHNYVIFCPEDLTKIVMKLVGNLGFIFFLSIRNLHKPK